MRTTRTRRRARSPCSSRSPSELGDLISLEERSLHVWLAEPVTSIAGAELGEFAGVLSEAERTRAERHAAAGQYPRSVLTRFMVRDVLSRYVATAPVDWQFRSGKHGKPEIAPPLAGPQFNISHTRDSIAMVVCQKPCGIDIEAADRAARFREVAERFFSPAEAQGLRVLDDAAGRRRFIETWTLKEAFVKALGRGLSFELLKSFAFRFEPSAALSFAPGANVGSEWRFWTMEVGDGCIVACAVPDAGPRELAVWSYRFGAAPTPTRVAARTFSGPT